MMIRANDDRGEKHTDLEACEAWATRSTASWSDLRAGVEELEEAEGWMVVST